MTAHRLRVLCDVGEASSNEAANADRSGLTLFHSAKGTIGDWDFFAATRTSSTAAFASPAQLTGAIQSTGADVAAFVAFDGALWFSSDRSGSGDTSRAPPQGAIFASPALVASPSSSADDDGIVPTHDGPWAYVSSFRADLGARGNEDVFLAHRATLADDFGALVDQADLDTVGSERADWISWDGCRLYFESDRNGSNDPFVATKQP